MRYLFNQIRERSFFCESESAPSVRSIMLDPRSTRDAASIDNQCWRSTSSSSYYESSNSYLDSRHFCLEYSEIFCLYAVTCDTYSVFIRYVAYCAYASCNFDDYMKIRWYIVYLDLIVKIRIAKYAILFIRKLISSINMLVLNNSFPIISVIVAEYQLCEENKLFISKFRSFWNCVTHTS